MSLVTKRSEVVKKASDYLASLKIPHTIKRRTKHFAIVGEYCGETFAVSVPAPSGDWKTKHLVFKAVRQALARVEGRRR